VPRVHGAQQLLHAPPPAEPCRQAVASPGENPARGVCDRSPSTGLAVAAAAAAERRGPYARAALAGANAARDTGRAVRLGGAATRASGRRDG
jgi:hypothetical protein